MKTQIRLINYAEIQINQYLKYLSIIGSLSRLFTDSNIPLLSYNATELLYCKSFDAENLSKSDIAIDVRYKNFGIAIKTFIEQKNNISYQKVAEFNKSLHSFSKLEAIEKIIKISELRNLRLNFIKDAYQIEELCYHFITRKEGKIRLHEEKMNFINLEKLKFIKEKSNTIYFQDDNDKYIFNSLKNTLYKEFNTSNAFANIGVNIIEDPFSELKNIDIEIPKSNIIREAIIPLYSYRDGKKIVFEKSGLNQWNSKGRPRHFDEAYIPYNRYAKDCSIDFFPNNINSKFNVILPNGKSITMKMCQDKLKGIMSNPNKDFGHWILRDVLKLKEGEICTYQKLLDLNIDSVLFTRIDENSYTLDFKEVGSFEIFQEKNCE